MNELPKYVSYDPDRHGNPRWYYRRNGKRIRLKGCPGDETFAQSYAAVHTERRSVKHRRWDGKGWVERKKDVNIRRTNKRPDCRTLPRVGEN